MKLRYKVLAVIVVLLGVALLSAALVLSHDSPCGPAPALASDANLMKGIVYRCYGSPDVLKLETIEKPAAADNQVLVKVHAASVNPLDWHYMRGTPYLVRSTRVWARPRRRGWALTSRAPSKRSARTSSGSSQAMRYSAGEMARLPSM